MRMSNNASVCGDHTTLTSAVFFGSLIPRPARHTGRKKSSSSSFEILPCKSGGRKYLQMASRNVFNMIEFVEQSVYADSKIFNGIMKYNEIVITLYKNSFKSL